MYTKLYDESDSTDKYIQGNTKVYTVKRKKEQNKQYIAKKYKYIKNQFLDNTWNEITSIVNVRDKQHPNVINCVDMFLFDKGKNCET